MIMLLASSQGANCPGALPMLTSDGRGRTMILLRTREDLVAKPSELIKAVIQLWQMSLLQQRAVAIVCFLPKAKWARWQCGRPRKWYKGAVP